MTEIPIVVSNNEVTVGGFVEQVELQLSVGPRGQRGSKIFSGDANPNSLPIDSPYWGGYTEFLVGDTYIQRAADLLAMWEWLFQGGEYTWVKTVDNFYGTSGGGSGTSDPDLDAIAALTGTGILKRTGINTWALDNAAYLTGNQTVTLSGDATGSGTTAITVSVNDDSHNHTGATISDLPASSISSGTFSILRIPTGTTGSTVALGNHTHPYQPVDNVLDYGATGDGVTDDTAAIEAAITAAGVGGAVYFPQGVYKVSRTLWPLNAQTWRGEHNPKYTHDSNPGSACAIVTASTFTGRALIERASGVYGVHFSHLCFLGNGDEATPELHGLHLGDMSAERAWKVQDCSIHGFSGAGLTGRMHVFDMRDCHVARCGYGLRVTDNNSLTDVRIFGCQFYFNLHGGLCLDSTTRSNGMVSVHGCRFERSGSTPGNPAVNRDPNAPGIRFQKGYNVDFVQCSTDANSGEGLLIIGDPANGMYTFGITVSDCKFARDGGGDQSAGTQLSGVKIKGASAVYFSSNVTWGEADDSGNGTGLISPYYSVTLENTSGCRIINSWIVAPNPLNSVRLVGTNSGAVIDGATPYIDLLGTNAQVKEIRYRIDDGAGSQATRWAAAVNPTANGGTWSVQRYNAAGAYVDSPIDINWGTGTVETRQQYVTSNSDSRPIFDGRSFSQTPSVSYLKLGKADGSPVFEILYDGTLRSNWGDSGYAMTQIGSVQVVRDGATGSQTMIGAYTSVAEANDDSPVFEVQADGSVWSDYVLGSGDGGKYLTPKAYVDAIKTSLKATVAASTSFTDFQSRIASW